MTGNKIRVLVAAALLTGAFAATAACSTGSVGATAAATTAPATATGTAATVSSSTVIHTCGRQAVARPTSLDVTCADSQMNLDGLQWSDWGTPAARATGTLTENNCTPDCAAGKDIPYQATVTLTGITHGHYTRMRIAAPSAPDQPYSYTLTAAGPA